MALPTLLGSPVALAPTGGWGSPTVYALPAVAIVSGYGQMIGGRIELKTGSVPFSAGVDIAVGAFASRKPALVVESPCTLHFGNATPVPGRATIGLDGTVNVRSSSTATMTAGSSALVILPPLGWPVAPD